MANGPSGSVQDPRPSRACGARVFLAVASLVAILVSVGSGLSIATIRHVERTITKLPTGPNAKCTGSACLPSVRPQCVRKACTFLILGSDSRAGLSKKEQSQFGNTNTVTGQRADTIILVQVDPVHDRTVVLSIPRDLRVDIPGHGRNKINTAFGYGPDVMVRTVSALTGLRINHYVQVNFAGFEKLVNSLGGIPICINKPLIDTLAGLNLPHAGCYNLRGSQALAFVRARHIKGDLIPDFSRISRQQQFIRAVIQKTLSAGSLFQLPALIKAVQKNLVLDANLDLYSLQDLTRKLANLGQGGVTFRVVPAIPIDIGGVSYLQLIQPAASILFRRIKGGLSLGKFGIESEATPISPANITVRVVDANSNGQAAKVVSYLRQAGFVVLGPETAPAALTKTVMLYPSGRLGQEEVVSSYLPGLSVNTDRANTVGADVTVVIGRDFPGVEF